MISVCIATYNGSRYILEQLTWILKQLQEDDEVIVSDDGSTDNTLDIVRNINDRRIKIVEKTVDNPRNSSLANNFENALSHAKGDYIFLSDQDDVWMPNKIAVMMKNLETYHCVVSDATVTDSELNTTYESFYKMMKVKSGRLYNLLWHNGYTGCCMAFRRDVLDRAMPFPDNIPMHDIWIGNVAAFFFDVHFIADKLIYFRRHKNATSCNGRGSKYSIRKQFIFRWQIVKDIMKMLKNKKINIIKGRQSRK